ncbi:MAG: FGGY-family carbohydrate kinase [Pirellulaceae bacterium]|jgi:sugar (pentulose or hexulose) kinase|nr:FGGY-family carbohydrate kinase [Pirellulaceae bacterium]
MAARERAVIGLDLGTSGARATAVTYDGRVVAEGTARLAPEATQVAGPRVEQDPVAWSAAAQAALQALVRQLPAAVELAALAVDATSGTFVITDRRGTPLTAGILYSDQRASDVTPEVAAALDPTLAPYGIQMASSFALPKLVHLARQQPALFQPAHRIVHQTDYLVGMLTGCYDTTDISTALKTGADPGRLTWPTGIERLGIPTAMLPRLVLPGTPLGGVTPEASAQTGIPAGLRVVAGCTDGTAGCLASGARAPGDLNVTLGTTLVFKAVADQPLADPQGAIYNHRHPAGGYLPGAASSTGAEWIDVHFPAADLAVLTRDARSLLPTGHCVYPLVKVGERFPFVAPQARGFGLEEIAEPPLRFAAGLEAVAYLERMAIERFEQLGLPINATVYATGGGAASPTWLQIRASVSGRALRVPVHPGCSVGAAVLAAMPELGSCQEAVARLVQLGPTIEPVTAWCAPYDDAYDTFRHTLARQLEAQGMP